MHSNIAVRIFELINENIKHCFEISVVIFEHDTIQIIINAILNSSETVL